MPDTPVTLTHELGRNTNNGSDNMFGGNSLIWIILLLFLFNRRGVGGDDGERAERVIGLTNEMLLNNLQQALNTGFQTVNNGISGINLELCKGFGALTHQIDIGNCDLKTAFNNGFQMILNRMGDTELREVRDRALAAEGALNNCQQSAAFQNALNAAVAQILAQTGFKQPIPAYAVPNPAVPFVDGFGHHKFA